MTENQIQVFNNEQFGQIRTVLIDGEPWFVGRDVAEALGYSNTKDAISSHVDTEDRMVMQRSENTTFEIPTRGLSIINESGLYSLILSSKLPNAKVLYYDAILASSEALPITQIAKDYGMSAVTLNRLLSEMEIQYKRCGTWILYQDYADKGYTQTKTFIINEKQTKSYTTWTQKGRLFLYNLLKAHGIVPMCERPEISGYISR